jgi:RAB protein geranylgeranyltransferase component A
VLHVDSNEYYGGAEAAFSLQEVEEWVTKVGAGKLSLISSLLALHVMLTILGTLPGPFTNASFFKVEDDDASRSESEKLFFSRAYTLALSPQIIYSRSRLLSQLVSSKVYRQLEFQAVGNWWIYDADTSPKADNASDTSTIGNLKRMPNGREDVFSDGGIDVRAKRNLIKFLKFVVDYEEQTEFWQPHAETPLHEFLAFSFNLPPSLQTVILALTLSLATPGETTVGYSLPRIARHLTSIGIFGPGFGSVIPKWGGSSEIAQVACRAGAVGGAVYMLGTGVAETKRANDSRVALTFTNDEAIKSLAKDGIILTKTFINANDARPVDAKDSSTHVSKMIAIVSSDVAPLFVTTVEGGPTAAVSVITFPSNSTTLNGQPQAQPIYIMAHSSETGECPASQCKHSTPGYHYSFPLSKLHVMIQTMNTYLHCLIFFDENIPLTV